MIEIFFQSFVIFVVNSFVFDCVHFVLHHFHSRWHLSHHHFFNNKLQINRFYQNKNIAQHVLVEFLIKFLTSVTFLLCFLWQSIAIAVAIEVFIVCYVLYYQGQDHNHRERRKLERPSTHLCVTANYHAMHHLYPSAYFSSHHFLFDKIFGTVCHIKNRRFLVTGSEGAFGSALVRILRKKGGIVDEPLPNSDEWPTFKNKLNTYPFHNVDVLILAHGSKWQATQENNIDSQKLLVTFFLKSQTNIKKLPEIWGVGSELECCSHINLEKIKGYVLSKRSFARFGKQLYADKSIIYRHIVPSSFTSKMGRGLMSPTFTAYVALFLIQRGARYVPISYTGIAYINYFNFLCRL